MSKHKLSWIEEELASLSKNYYEGEQITHVDATEYCAILEALKAAREALESCKVEQHAIMRFDCGKVEAAKTKIDNLGG